jgi:hypothetical protein
MNDALRSMIEQARAQEALRRSLLPDNDVLARFRSLSEALRVHDVHERLATATAFVNIGEQLRRATEANRLAPGIRDAIDAYSTTARLHGTNNIADLIGRLQAVAPTQQIYERALEAARFSERVSLPGVLADFRTPTQMLAARLSVVGESFQFSVPHVQAFAQTSAFANLIDESARLGAGFAAARAAFADAVIPSFETLQSYRRFLDAAGLGLPHWPRPRLLTMAEKRRQLRARISQNVEPPHLKKAKSLVYRYEITLQEILDTVMADIYGEDWPDQRLPLCNCKDLLGKWKKRGGSLFEHADYAHYERIMSHPEHFAAIFQAGFDDPVALADLLKKAATLRARSHHPGPFTPADLRDLRITWRALEKGLLAFTADFTVEF